MQKTLSVEQQFEKLNRTAEGFFASLGDLLCASGKGFCLNHVGSLGCVFFTGKTVRNYEDAQSSDTKRFADYFRKMLDKGIYLAPSQFEAMFLSAAHSSADLEQTLAAAREALG